MPKHKTETLNIRLGKPLKDALKRAAEAEQRSISNLIERLISIHCETLGIAVTNPRDNITISKDSNA